MHVKDQITALRKMRRFAGGLLLVMIALFLISKLTESFVLHYKESHGTAGFIVYHLLGFIRHFSEAAMVGAIADWFAVTALFRHPLGLKIPHTAIIPENKDSIGEGLGYFVTNNFLTTEALTEKIKSFDLDRRLEEWLAVPGNSEFIAENIASILPSILNSLDDDEVREFIERNISLNLSGKDLSIAAGNLLTMLTQNNKHYDLFDELLKVGERLLEENKPLIRSTIKEESPWFVPEFVRTNVYQKIITRIEETFKDMANNPNHALRIKFHEATQQLINDLKNSEIYHNKIDTLKNEVLKNDAVSLYFEQIWRDLKVYLLDNIAKPDSAIRRQIQQYIYSFFNNLINDVQMRNRITNWVYTTAIGMIVKYRNEIGNMISGTIKSWDKKTMASKLELQVGKDLQYIRVSGTLVGGTVGLLLHIFSLMIEAIFTK